MASRSAPHERSKISWESSDAEDSRPSSPTTGSLRKSKAETACTRFSLATTNFASAKPSPEGPALALVKPPSRPLRGLQRRSTVSLFSLLRSSRRADRDSKRSSAFAPPAAEQTKSKRSSRWWPPNQPVPKSDKSAQRTAPPIPPRPPPLFSTEDLGVIPILRPVSTHETTRNDRPSNRQALTTIQQTTHYPELQQLAELETEKQDSEFNQIDPEGWDKVVPKKWMEDQFSHTSPSVDEEGSVYSQDNGEEEAKRKLTARLTSAVNYHGFLAGEATPFDPLSAVQVEAPSQTLSPGSHVTEPQEVESQETTRWPFAQSGSSSLTSLPTSSPVHHWLSSIRPPSKPLSISSDIQRAETDLIGIPRMNQKVPTQGDNSALSGDDLSISEIRRKRLSNVKNLRKVKLSHVRDHPMLIPEPLTLRPRTARAAASLATIQSEEQSTRPVGELPPIPSPPNLQPQVPAPLDSSWSTVQCTHDDDGIPIIQTSPEAMNSPSKRESDRNKPLPLPPSEANTRAQSMMETQDSNSKRDSLTDTIDEILDLYYYDREGDDNSSEEKQQQEQLSLPLVPRITSSTATASTTQASSSTPPKRPLRTPDTEISPLSSFRTNMPRAGDARFVAAYPIFYDAGSYPELGQGRATVDGNEVEDGQKRSRRSGRAVVTFVDEMGGTWI